MKKPKPLPVVSLLLIVAGAVLASESEQYWWATGLIAAGMIGVFISIVKYR